MRKRKFTEEEVKDLLWEHEVEEKQVGSGRWEAYMESIVLADDGKYYKIEWAAGLTEMQENTVEAQEATEVELVERTEVVKKWVPVEGEK